MGMGRVGESNSNLGSHQLLENMFLTSWASKCLGMHAHPIMDPYILLSLMQWELLGSSLHVFMVVSSLHIWEKNVFDIV